MRHIGTPATRTVDDRKRDRAKHLPKSDERHSRMAGSGYPIKRRRLPVLVAQGRERALIEASPNQNDRLADASARRLLDDPRFIHRLRHSTCCENGNRAPCGSSYPLNTGRSLNFDIELLGLGRFLNPVGDCDHHLRLPLVGGLDLEFPNHRTDLGVAVDDLSDVVGGN
jgi:hypothetical protein